MTELSLLNLAHFVVGSESLGPGYRSIIWVQGCPFRCRGCISPEWQIEKENILVSVEDFAQILLNDPKIEGLTISGGEPIMQAKELSKLIKTIRMMKDINVVCFTGFLLEDLRNIQDDVGIGSLLQEVDVLIDGPYIEALNDNHGLRGSSNQKVHFLTDKLTYFDFDNHRRDQEIIISGKEITFVGIPTKVGLIIMDTISKSL